MAPIAPRIAGKDLVIAASGPLSQLPFGALVAAFDTATDSPVYAVSQHRIRYAPSLSTLNLLRQWRQSRPQPTVPLFAVADPVYPEASSADRRDFRALSRLKHSDPEVRAAAQMLKASPASVRLRERASERHVKAASASGELGAARVVHFATHALLTSGERRLPCLVLSQNSDDREDGLLQLHEVAQLRLNADLVVLSACDTAAGRLYEGEGMHSLARTFLLAGSNAVVSSLWSVSDENTPLLMQDFYREFTERHDVADALRAAQLRQIREGKSPFLWAPFVCVGQ
jgi:CHAT domain-containing protein